MKRQNKKGSIEIFEEKLTIQKINIYKFKENREKYDKFESLDYDTIRNDPMLDY